MKPSRLKGLVALAAAAVEHGSAAIEKVQLETAGRTFGILESIPPLTVPTKIVRAVHDVSVKTTHGSIRLVTAIVKGGVDVAIDTLEARSPQPDDAGNDEGGEAAPPGGEGPAAS